MPEQETLRRARRDAAEGKSPSTQAGEFVREQVHHIREGKHGARSTKQAIAIGLSEARRAGVPLAPPKGRGETTRKARRDVAAGAKGKRPSPKRSRARVKALKKEGRSAGFAVCALSPGKAGGAQTRTKGTLPCCEEGGADPAARCGIALALPERSANGVRIHPKRAIVTFV